MRYTDIMVDIETLASVSEFPFIIQIGAVLFNVGTGEIGPGVKLDIEWPKTQDFPRPHDIDHAGPRHNVIEADTVAWWLQQSADARESILAEPRHDAHKCATQLLQFFQDNLDHDARIWANPAHFDIPRLRNWIQFLNYGDNAWPFGRWSERCYQSVIKTLWQKRLDRQGVHHDALADAEYQTKNLLHALRAVREHALQMTSAKKAES